MNDRIARLRQRFPETERSGDTERAVIVTDVFQEMLPDGVFGNENFTQLEEDVQNDIVERTEHRAF